MLLALIGGAGSTTTTTTNYALLLALTSDVTTVTPTGTTNYALLLALTSESGTPAPEPTPIKRGGATYLTQAELRRLRKQLDHKEARDRADRDRIGHTVAKAYEHIHPPIRVAPESKKRAKPTREQIEQEDEEFLLFLLDNYDTLH